MIEIETLWKLIDDHVAPAAPVEVELTESLGCVLADGVFARLDMPGFDHSSMDGYAFADIHPGACPVVYEIPAGASAPGAINAGECARIFTGAPIPTGAIAVARQEDCEFLGQNHVRPKDGVRLSVGDNIRRRGAIFRAGQSLIEAGAEVSAGVVALLAAAGINRVNIHPLPSVLHVATGSELLAPDDPPAPGKIYDSNGPMIHALLADLHIKVDRQRIADSLDALQAVIESSSGDLLLISGGSGPGDFDHSTAALERAGFKIHASRINSRPGKPLIFATRGNQVAFGLPGNPLSHWVCFHAFVRRAIARLTCRQPLKTISGSLHGDFSSGGDGRPTWTPGSWDVIGGNVVVTPMTWQHSGDLSCLIGANALIRGGSDPATGQASFFKL